MIALLLAAALGLLLVTAVGIAGLASFWVQQRRRAIGIRRAVGATRRDIRTLTGW
ncbi:FtsX-like permease family protein [Streptococcus thermophilus]|uniref:FtsX-like permease family protein n=1 Tax=Streptococcus thermophilus TaxID=1308 RepID=UPI00300E3C0F